MPRAVSDTLKYANNVMTKKLLCWGINMCYHVQSYVAMLFLRLTQALSTFNYSLPAEVVSVLFCTFQSDICNTR